MLWRHGCNRHLIRHPTEDFHAILAQPVHGLHLNPGQVHRVGFTNPSQLARALEALQHHGRGIWRVVDGVALVDGPVEPVHEHDPERQPVAHDDDAHVGVVTASDEVLPQLVLEHGHAVVDVGPRLPMREAVEEPAIAQPLLLVALNLLQGLEVAKVLLAELDLLSHREHLVFGEGFQDAVHRLPAALVGRAVQDEPEFVAVCLLEDLTDLTARPESLLPPLIGQGDLPVRRVGVDCLVDVPLRLRVPHEDDALRQLVALSASAHEWGAVHMTVR
mmetsp:Transcript_20829/g.49659  ORF Transcript_20829/g.49659 Transcript_20829/m.49659 type:complete len:275 (-) Transcript_20829:646-1470(-)